MHRGSMFVGTYRFGTMSQRLYRPRDVYAVCVPCTRSVMADMYFVHVCAMNAVSRPLAGGAFDCLLSWHNPSGDFPPEAYPPTHQ
jgi:hypothetical protein